MRAAWVVRFAQRMPRRNSPGNCEIQMSRILRALPQAMLVVALVGCAKEPQHDGRVDQLPIPTATDLAKIAELPSPYNSGNPSKGRLAFGDCTECHTLAANGSQEKGPSLYSIVGRRAASGRNFAYSEALRNSNIVWDAPHLDQWIFNPHETLPGTSMTYIGIRNDVRRHDVLAYLIAVTN